MGRTEPPASKSERDVWITRLVLFVLLGGLTVLGVWCECRTEKIVRGHVEAATRCMLGDRELEEGEQIADRLDLRHRAAARQGVDWPARCGPLIEDAIFESKSFDWYEHQAALEELDEALERGDRPAMAESLERLRQAHR